MRAEVPASRYLLGYRCHLFQSWYLRAGIIPAAPTIMGRDGITGVPCESCIAGAGVGAIGEGDIIVAGAAGVAETFLVADI